ncbi:MAG: hypothetical protein JEY96_09120 [Bacteroidales bacterium]|nr:hypothetical protein [Bacteroidales bacterium]
MLKYILILLVFAVATSVQSQNLVSNYSFEEFVDCPDEVTIYSEKTLIPHWYLPTRGTSDYFNACTIHQVNVPDNVMGSMLALDGNAYAGLVLIERPPSEVKMKKPLNYREYLQTELKEPLKAGRLYSFTFYFSIASYSTYAVNRIGMHVSKSKESNRLKSKVLQLNPQIELDTLTVSFERDYWHQVCDTLRAKGGEKYITIGNFYDDYNTAIEKLDYSIYRGTIQQTIKENKIAYYYIDVVSVTEIPDSSSAICNDRFLINNRD